MDYIKKKVAIRWQDSYGALPGWQEVAGFMPGWLVVTSYGTVIYEDDKIISIAQNYAEETEYTPEQANGIMTIPKDCILSITSLPDASCGEIERGINDK